MAFRSSTYTQYQNKEYRVVKREGIACLISNDIEDLKNGFIEYGSQENDNQRFFIKMVNPENLDIIYDIETYALYHGYEFLVVSEKSDEFILSESKSPLVAQQMGFIIYDKGVYHKTVKKEDLDLIYEKKTLRPDFF